MEKEVDTLRFIFPVFRFFLSSRLQLQKIISTFKARIKPNCFDIRNAEIFPESYYIKPHGIIRFDFGELQKNW
jgi:hypothetical protein